MAEPRTFCTTQEKYEMTGFKGARFGRPWTGQEIHALQRLILSGYTLKEVCEEMGRPAEGVLIKAVDRRFLYAPDWQCRDIGKYTVNPRLESAPAPAVYPLEEKEETEMSNEAKNIETVVLIQGENAANKSDTELYALIAKIESRKRTLSAIENKPKKLEKALAELQDDIDKIVKYVDERE